MDTIAHLAAIGSLILIMFIPQLNGQQVFTLVELYTGNNSITLRTMTGQPGLLGQRTGL